MAEKSFITFYPGHDVLKLFTAVINFFYIRNKLEYLSLASFPALSKVCVKAGAYPSEALFTFWALARLLGLPTNIRQGWKDLPGTNTLAYMPAVSEKKIFDIGTCANVVKLYTTVSYKFWNKLECSSLASLSRMVQCLWVRQKPIQVKHLSGDPL
jgi:hypothetical protein